MQTAVTGRQRGMTNAKVQQRNDLIFELAINGLRSITILEHVNRVGREREWQPLQDVRSVQRVVHDRLASQRPVPNHKLREYHDAMFQADMVRLEFLHEKLALHRLRTKTWRPFEFMKHIESESKLINNMYELWEKKRAWDATLPKEPGQAFPETEHQRDIKPVLQLLDECLEMQPA